MTRRKRDPLEVKRAQVAAAIATNRKRFAKNSLRESNIASVALLFKLAFAPHRMKDRRELDALLDEYDTQGPAMAPARRAKFKLVNVPALLARTYGLSTVQVRTIIKNWKVR